jgi:hypothetical protein
MDRDWGTPLVPDEVNRWVCIALGEGWVSVHDDGRLAAARAILARALDGADDDVPVTCVAIDRAIADLLY